MLQLLAQAAATDGNSRDWHELIIISLIAAAIFLITALAKYALGRAKKEILGSIHEFLPDILSNLKDVNAAVNHREEKAAINNGVVPPTLLEMVLELYSWRQEYKGGPFDSGDKVVEFFQRQAIDRADLREHITLQSENLRILEEDVRGIHLALGSLDRKLSNRPCILVRSGLSCPDGQDILDDIPDDAPAPDDLPTAEMS